MQRGQTARTDACRYLTRGPNAGTSPFGGVIAAATPAAGACRPADQGERGLRRMALAAVVFGVVCSCFLGLLAGAPGARASSKLSWLAAGDSFSSGEGLPHSTGRCSLAAPGSGSETWATAASQSLNPNTNPFSAPKLVACSGYKTTQFFDGNDPEWKGSDGKFNLVTFTFGGDDVDFPDVLAQCVAAACPSDSSLRERIAAKMVAPYRAFLTKVAENAVTPGGNILVLGYPELIEDPQFWTGLARRTHICELLGEGEANEIRGLAGDLNATIGEDVAVVNAAHPRGVHLTFVDVNSGGSAGVSRSDPNLFEPSSGARHNLCSADSWMNGLSTIDRVYNGSYHPKQAGQNAMGFLAAEVIPTLPGLAAGGSSGGGGGGQGGSGSGAGTGSGAGAGGGTAGSGSGATLPAGSIAETAGGVTHTWTDYSDAGGTEGPSIASNETVGVTCKISGFAVADGDAWWYEVASSPWSNGYYASADAFYNDGATSGALQGTPFVDPNVPTCAGSSQPPSGPGTYSETPGGVTHTWTDYSDAGGTEGPSIPSNATVQITCRVTGFKVADGDTWWYQVASSPWSNAYYASADAFYNNGATSGSLIGTPFVDPNVPNC
jgi:hypothetical protein